MMGCDARKNLSSEARAAMRSIHHHYRILRFPQRPPKTLEIFPILFLFFRRRFKGIEMPQSGLFSATTPESPPTLFSAQSGLCSLSRNNRGREEERGNLDAIKRSGGKRKESTTFCKILQENESIYLVQKKDLANSYLGKKI